MVRSGSAKAIRDTNPGHRTVQIIYALLITGRTNRIKSASLGSDAKDPKATDFYKYLSSFAGHQHVWEYVTNISAILEKRQETYYCMNFKRGDKLDEKFLAVALEKMKEVHLKCVEIDTARKQKRSVDSNLRPTLAEDTNASYMPSDDAPPNEVPDPLKNVSPDDIPF